MLIDLKEVGQFGWEVTKSGEVQVASTSQAEIYEVLKRLKKKSIYAKYSFAAQEFVAAYEKALSTKLSSLGE